MVYYKNFAKKYNILNDIRKKFRDVKRIDEWKIYEDYTDKLELIRRKKLKRVKIHVHAENKILDDEEKLNRIIALEEV